MFSSLNKRFFLFLLFNVFHSFVECFLMCCIGYRNTSNTQTQLFNICLGKSLRHFPFAEIKFVCVGRIPLEEHSTRTRRSSNRSHRKNLWRKTQVEGPCQSIQPWVGRPAPHQHTLLSVIFRTFPIFRLIFGFFL